MKNKDFNAPREWGCRFPLDGVMTSPQGDYLVRTNYMDNFTIKVEAGKKKLRKEIIEKTGAREGTCLYTLVGHVVNGVGFDGDGGDRMPYCFVYNLDGMERWSKSTVRNNLKKLENMGIVSIYKPPADVHNIYKKLNKILSKGKDKLSFRKLVVSNLNLDSNEMGIDDDDFEAFSTDKIIRCVSAGELEEMRNEGIIAEDYDIRGLSKEERTKYKQRLYENMKREVYKNRKEIMPKEKKLELIDETVEKLGEMPHIKEVYLAGSFARDSDVTGSDIDMVLVRESCPGMEACYNSFKKSPLDIFCFTQDEIKGLREKGAVLLSTLSRLK